MTFLLAELGTSGSLDGQQRLVVKGRFAPKVFEGILRRYVSKSLYFWLLEGLPSLSVGQAALRCFGADVDAVFLKFVVVLSVVLTKVCKCSFNVLWIILVQMNMLCAMVARVRTLFFLRRIGCSFFVASR